MGAPAHWRPPPPTAHWEWENSVACVCVVGACLLVPPSICSRFFVDHASVVLFPRPDVDLFARGKSRALSVYFAAKQGVTIE